ncbi:carbohydrate kinase [Lithospermum erythrorhizon]|uniref:Carbohydrate kinase n=1 Tax=Lithospermum erythrorhizon TaxID=34254 RepID=A0AAV3QVD9_LITER
MAKNEELAVPTYSKLEEVYGSGSQLEEAEIRFKNLKDKFVELFGQVPDVFARSPGRVNLIGEHIDYEGYSVLPMAIRQDTIVAIRKNSSEKLLRIGNVKSDKYAMCTYNADPNQVYIVALSLFNYSFLKQLNFFGLLLLNVVAS